MGHVLSLQQPRPDDYVWAIKRIKKLWNEGAIEFTPYCQRRMEQRQIFTSDVRDIIRSGHIVGHSKPDEHWRYEIEGKSIDLGRGSCIVEIASHLIVVNAYAANRQP